MQKYENDFEQSDFKNVVNLLSSDREPKLDIFCNVLMAHIITTGFREVV